MHYQTLAARNGLADAEHLLLLHGWGIASSVWQPCLSQLNENYHITLVDLPGFGRSVDVPSQPLPVLLAQLNQLMPAPYTVLGFSLGGMLAVQLAAQFPQRVQRLISIASNAVFVQQEGWPQAMADEIFQQFYQLAERSPAACLKRFLLLQAKGSDDEKNLVKKLRELSDEQVPSANSLTAALRLLVDIDNRAALKNLPQPVLCILGEHDQLVPVACASNLEPLATELQVISGASHVPLVSDAQKCCAAISAFMQRHPVAISHESCCEKKRNKLSVAKSFAKAASTYDEVAGLQRDIGQQLLSYLPKTTGAERVLDLGCGTGYFLPKLQQQLAPQQLVAFDLAEGMLQFARGHRDLESTIFLCGDAEAMPLADNSVDIIFSSLAIQWCEAPQDLFAEIFRVLKPGGRFVFATLGPDTLKELRSAWQQVDSYVHVNQFLAQAVVTQAIARAGFAVQHWQEQTVELQYSKLNQLTRELKALGAHNVNAGRPTGLTGKQRIKALLAAYEQYRNPQGMLPATYQVWYGVVAKPLETSEESQHG
ncbi:malonyl-ACP O-methyltransferase BioC [Dasania sp. GY-MA-18]|uniref:Malonyl-[acyl-carrier protein] O-methyltransferase n=1 Tax=Dasania phycosphaerae TaxID=2950436 RepID=A0A9J6RKE7_9GAMM|nr:MULTISPECIES: malonyl-ACP O-methyltransferase BioC [Dasania]MCR8922397.1 malonyl-ACP O-methyltransferase BioC [Dasania sp. GY-MA-18]MCZ0864825.1 malonyl-ACP O-methyltransferase BioC [Dasania phycosphaerae]MCZ0868553.1 malonyl-ACP O-methyltransferase BioC [Dasania phycosphaerae]